MRYYKDDEDNVCRAVVADNPCSIPIKVGEELSFEQFTDFLSMCENQGGEKYERENEVTLNFRNGNKKPMGRGSDFVTLKKLDSGRFIVTKAVEMFKS